jgi:hypothetical protein
MAGKALAQLEAVMAPWPRGEMKLSAERGVGGEERRKATGIGMRSGGTEVASARGGISIETGLEMGTRAGSGDGDTIASGTGMRIPGAAVAIVCMSGRGRGRGPKTIAGKAVRSGASAGTTGSAV